MCMSPPGTRHLLRRSTRSRSSSPSHPRLLSSSLRSPRCPDLIPPSCLSSMTNSWWRNPEVWTYSMLVLVPAGDVGVIEINSEVQFGSNARMPHCVCSAGGAAAGGGEPGVPGLFSRGCQRRRPAGVPGAPLSPSALIFALPDAQHMCRRAPAVEAFLENVNR
jgi:hypothetical protein